MTSYESEDMATTPRPNQTTFAQISLYGAEDPSTQKTPTRDSFQPYANQIPALDTSNTGSSYETTTRAKPRKAAMERSASLRSSQSTTPGNMNMNMNMDDEMNEASDNESVASDGRPQKKKKGQKFYCVDYPPCNLSFTRSEHLARHIRKHTGERPFQCHCLRRFSRLDNLRQHAQTVHLNEDIPQDSLAATGTRFQRQIRTDRVRAPGGRARASTLSSQGSAQSRTHSRNISTSSIGSASEFPTTDQANQQNRGQGPPQALAMGPPPTTPMRGALSLDTYGVGAGGPEHPYYPFYPQNTGYSPPNSIYSTDPSSPLAHTGLQSPIAMVPRGVTWVQPLQARRMSVPSIAAPFQSPSSYASGMSYMSPFASSHPSTFSNSSMITSPTNFTFSDQHSDLAAEAEHRRRTWHLGHQSSYEQRPATSGLSYYQTPDAPKPLPSTQAAAAQNKVRLPGIDSFDRGGGNSSSAQPGVMSPTNVDHPANQQFTAETQYAATPDAQMRNNRVILAPQRRNHQYTKSAPQSLETAALDMQAQPSNSPLTPRRQKRNAWYNGPLQTASQQHDTEMTTASPANSSGSEAPHTPSAMSLTEYQPAIIHSNGFVEPLPPGLVDDPSKVPQLVHASRSLQHTMQPQAVHEYPPNRHRGDMDRLDALVAVATSENQATKT